MKKVWAIACVVGFTAFWAYGFVALAGTFGDRPDQPMAYLLCLVGLAIGVLARFRLMALTPSMHGRRAKARRRMEVESPASAVPAGPDPDA